MEWWVILLGIVVVLTILKTERSMESFRRDVARMNGKLDQIFKEMNISSDVATSMSEGWKKLASDPKQKIEAIKLYREETGAGLAEAKDAVERYALSLAR